MRQVFLSSGVQRTTSPNKVQPSSLVLTAGASVLQQLVEDAGLLQRSEVGDVLCDNRDVLAVIHFVTFVFVAVGQRAEEGVVLIRGEVIPEERSRS